MDTTDTVASGSSRNWAGETLIALALVLIIVIGAFFRFTGLNWDENYHLHPDERFLTIVTSSLQPVSDPLSYLRTSESTLNPYNVGQSFYVYGNFPVTVTRYFAEAVNNACGYFAPSFGSGLCLKDYTGYDGVHLAGRFLSALMDLSTVIFTFFIGRRLYDWRSGLLGALLYATSVLAIQHAHFYTMDTWAAALTTMTLYTAVRAATLGDETPRWRAIWYILFGIGLGLVAASRINLAPLAIMIAVGAGIWLLRANAITVPTIANFRALPSPDLSRAIFGVALAAVISLLVFRVAQPYAFTDGALAREQLLTQTGVEPGPLGTAIRSILGFNQIWVSNMEEIQRLQAPDAMFPPANQWVDRPAVLFPLTNLVLYGMGPVTGIMAWLSLLWALWRIVRFKPGWMNHLIPVLWSLGYFLFMGTRWVTSIRYFLPIYPTLLLLAAWGVLALWDSARSSSSRQNLKQAGAVGLALLMVGTTLLWASSFAGIYQRPVTRVAASDWIFENVPTGATLVYTVNGEQRQIQLPLKEFLFEAGGSPLILDFSLPENGKIDGVRLNYLSTAPAGNAPVEQAHIFDVSLNGSSVGQAAVSRAGSEAQPHLLDLVDTAVVGQQPQQLAIQLVTGGPLQARTSFLANEEWDDSLPVNTGGRSAFSSYYDGATHPVTHPDSPEKLENLTAWLEEADYVVLSSQRALWSLPRLALSFPLMIRYYRGLFSGELGFELVHQEHADLRIGPLFLSDTTGQIGLGGLPNIGWPPPGAMAAEEAFSVYDHPPVWIFQKTDDYDPARAREILSSVDLSHVTVMNPLQATQARNGLLLSPADQARQQANGTFSTVFAVDGVLSQQPFLAAVVWWLAVVVLGWLAFPLSYATLRGLPDRGYALARILAMLVVSYFAWLMGSLKWLPHTRETLLIGVSLLAVVSLLISWRRRREIWTFAREHWGLLLSLELIGVFLFVLQIGIRLGNPDVWDVIWGGEKPMDLSYFTAVMKSTTFPPYDPWFAGGYLNYYYYGFVFAGVLAKLLGVVPTVAYNLILPMLYSFAGLGVFSIAYNLVRYRDRNSRGINEQLGQRRATWAGFLAMVLAVIVGNLAQVGVLLDAWYRTGTESLASLPLVGNLARTADGAIKVLSGQPAPLYPGDWFWNATRALNYLEGEAAPITEFPFFTFLYGDLHAHMISIPLQLLALGWAIGLALQGNGELVPNDIKANERILAWWEVALQWLVGALAIGSLRATNTWDWPTYLVIGSLAIAFMSYRQYSRLDLRVFGQSLVLVSLLLGLSTALFWPFAANYGTGYSSLSLWPGSYTEVGSYLKVYGVFLFFVITFLLLEFRGWARTWTQEGLRKLEPVAGILVLALVLYLVLLFLLIVRGYWVAPIVLTLIIASGLLGLRPGIDAARRVVLILISCALGLTLAVEIVVLNGDIGRMNTVFKFYMQAWLLLSVTSGAAAVWSWELISKKGSMRIVWQVAVALLLAAAALYPILATQAKWDIRMSKEAPNTLDGMAFMPYVEYSDSDFAGNSVTVPLANDYAALQWMQRNISGSPIIAEAHSGNPYRSIANRVAMYTGLPAVIGWDWHQRQQRAVIAGEFVTDRIQDVNTLYTSADIPQAQKILDKYNVAYVYVGDLERAYYPPEGLAKFETMAAEGLLQIAYQDLGVTIYKVEEPQQTG